MSDRKSRKNRPTAWNPLGVLTFLALAGAASADCTAPAATNSCLPGGGSRMTDCRFEWQLAGTATLKRDGMPKPRSVCYEGDPACDLDPNLTNASCTFSVRLCINNADPRLPFCSADDVDAFELRVPNPTHPRDVADSANVTALESAAGSGAGGLGLSIVRRDAVVQQGAANDDANACSGSSSIRVPLRTSGGSPKNGRRTLRVRSTSTGTVVDTDTLRLECRPSTCGDGVIQNHELCDDGNRLNGDGCNQACHLEPPTPTPTATSTSTPSSTATITGTSTPTSVVPQADLSVTMTDDPDPVAVSSSLHYAIAVKNNGSLAATNVALTDTLPTGATLVSATAAQGSCTPLVGLVVCNLGAMPVGLTVPIDIVVTTPVLAATISNTASVLGVEPDTNATNNTATEETEVLTTVPPTPTRTPTPAVPIGSVVVNLSGASAATLQTRRAAINLNLSGHFTIDFGVPGDDGVATVVIPKDKFRIDPVAVAGIGNACVSLAEDGEGSIDCDGGLTNRDVLLTQDHVTTPGNTYNSGSANGLPDDPECDDTVTFPNGQISSACTEGSACDPQDAPRHAGICNSPRSFALSGTLGAGDSFAVANVVIAVIQNGSNQAGPDGQPCTADDTPGIVTQSAVILTTGQASVRVVDADRANGAEIAQGANCGLSCKAQVAGAAFSCGDLRNAITTGSKVVGGFPSLDIDPLGDGAITFTLAAQ